MSLDKKLRVTLIGLAVIGAAATMTVVPRPAGAADPPAGAPPAAGVVEPGTLAPQLEPFRPLLGKTWKATRHEAESDRDITDVSRWERALNGQAVRVLHAINDGEYGGESLIFWEAAKQSLVYYYFTTAGFYTNGTMTIDGGRWIGHEFVTGNANNITEVKSTSELLPDGRLHVTAQYMVDGKWAGGREFFYSEDPAAKVVFR